MVFVNRKMTLGIGSKLRIWHLSLQVKFTLITSQWVSAGPWKKWKVIFSPFHWFMLHIYVHLQLKLLLVNGFIGSCDEKTMTNPGMWSLNISVKLGHIKGAVFTSELGKPKAPATPSWYTWYSYQATHLCLFYPEEAGAFLQVDFQVCFKPIQFDPKKEVLLKTSSQRCFQLAFHIPFRNQILCFFCKRPFFFLSSLTSITSHKLSP